MNSVQTNIYQTHLAEEPLLLHDASSMFQLVKNLPAMQKTPVQFLGWKDPLEKGKATQYSWASLAAQLVKNPPAMWETWLWSLGWEDPLEKGKATHFSILAWRIPWTVYGVAKNLTRLSDFHFPSNNKNQRVIEQDKREGPYMAHLSKGSRTWPTKGSQFVISSGESANVLGKNYLKALRLERVWSI